MENRIVTLIDMDCFYCQVETRLNPLLRGRPVAVVQYNQWKGGGIIAVNYEARDLGVTRFMRGEEALQKCPQIQLVSVPEVRGKADLSKYREASREVIAVLSEFCSCIEKASIDEAYLDITNLVKTKNQNERITADKLKNTFVIGYDSRQEGTEQWLNDIYSGGINDSFLYGLAHAASLVEEIRAAILAKTGFHCSAGIAHNKTLAKLACTVHKPKRQTVLPPASVPILYAKLPVKKIKNLGGKFGDLVHESLGAQTMADVSKHTLKELRSKFGDKSGLWLYNIARGIDDEPVRVRTISKSIGCCKNFKGLAALTKKKEVKHWLTELCTEIYDRIHDDLITNKRKATLLVVSAQENVEGSTAISKSTSLKSYDFEDILKGSVILLNKLNRSQPDSSLWEPPLKFLGVSVGKFIPADSSKSLLTFFKLQQIPERTDNDSKDRQAIDLNSFLNAPDEKTNLNCATSAAEASTVFLDNSFTCTDCDGPHQCNGSSARNTAVRVKLSTVFDYRDSFFCEYFEDKIISAPNVTKKTIDGVEISAYFGEQSKEHFTSSKSNFDSECLVMVGQNDVRAIQNYDSLDCVANDRNSESDPFREDNRTLLSAVTSEKTNKEIFDFAKGSTSSRYCESCQQFIYLEDLLVHSDYHAARELHKKLNISSATAAKNDLKRSTEFYPRNPTNASALKVVGKSRLKKSNENRFNPSAKYRPITSFFPPKP